MGGLSLWLLARRFAASLFIVRSLGTMLLRAAIRLCTTKQTEARVRNCVMQAEVLTRLAARLYGLRHAATVVPLFQVSIGDGSQPDDWTARAHYCHANVDIWVARCPEYEPVRGWVIFDLSRMPPSMKVSPHLQFSAHSVVRAPDGKLIDITP
jgi:hypothetical protein